MLRAFLIIAIATGLSACGSTSAVEKSADVANTGASKTKCVYEKTTDSRIGKKICRTVSDD